MCKKWCYFWIFKALQLLLWLIPKVTHNVNWNSGIGEGTSKISKSLVDTAFSLKINVVRKTFSLIFKYL